MSEPATAPVRTITRLRLLELTGGLKSRERTSYADDQWSYGLWHMDVIPLTPGILAGLTLRYPTINWSTVQ